MSIAPTHTGYWIDETYGSVRGALVTLTVKQTLVVVSATAVFLIFVAGGVWTIYGLCAHQCLAVNPTQDLVDLQHRVIYRNDSSPQAAMIDAVATYWAWKPWSFRTCSGRPRRADHMARRSLSILIPAFMIFSAFTAAGVGISFIASDQSQQTRVLIQSLDSFQSCGIAVFNAAIDSNRKFDENAARYTRTAMAYSRTCYPRGTGTANHATCASFIKPALIYSQSLVQCPFGSQPFRDSICAWNGNQAALRITTSWLDSHHDFGINAKPTDRLQLQKEVVCSPLSQTGFLSSEPGFGSQNSSSTISYNYGPAPNIQNATYKYNTAAQYDNVPFEIFTLYHNATQKPSAWVPHPAISRDDADVTIIFVAPNSVRFRDKVNDPIFKSTYSTLELDHEHTYHPDNKTGVLACTEQYQICVTSARCTPYTALLPLQSSLSLLNLNPVQAVTASRLIYTIAGANLYSSINGIGPEALRMYERVYNFISPGVPDNQWQLEVEGWMQITLAKWQASMVEFAYNTADLGYSGHLEFPDVSDSGLQSNWQQQCRSQMVANLGGYQNVNVLTLASIYVIGSALILIGLILPYLVFDIRSSWPQSAVRSTMSRKIRRRLAWIIDGKFQIQRLAFETAGYTDFEATAEDVPFLRYGLSGDPPFDEVIDNYHVCYRGKYIATPLASHAFVSTGGTNASHLPNPIASSGGGVALQPAAPLSTTLATTTASPLMTTMMTTTTSATAMTVRPSSRPPSIPPATMPPTRAITL